MGDDKVADAGQCSYGKQKDVPSANHRKNDLNVPETLSSQEIMKKDMKCSKNKRKKLKNLSMKLSNISNTSRYNNNNNMLNCVLPLSQVHPQKQLKQLSTALWKKKESKTNGIESTTKSSIKVTPKLPIDNSSYSRGISTNQSIAKHTSFKQNSKEKSIKSGGSLFSQVVKKSFVKPTLKLLPSKADASSNEDSSDVSSHNDTTKYVLDSCSFPSISKSLSSKKGGCLREDKSDCSLDRVPSANVNKNNSKFFISKKILVTKKNLSISDDISDDESVAKPSLTLYKNTLKFQSSNKVSPACTQNFRPSKGPYSSNSKNFGGDIPNTKFAMKKTGSTAKSILQFKHSKKTSTKKSSSSSDDSSDYYDSISSKNVKPPEDAKSKSKLWKRKASNEDESSDYSTGVKKKGPVSNKFAKGKGKKLKVNEISMSIKIIHSHPKDTNSKGTTSRIPVNRHFSTLEVSRQYGASNLPFRRVRPEDHSYQPNSSHFLNRKNVTNSYERKDLNALSALNGKDFKREKDKIKRKAFYSGRRIDMDVNSKFFD